MLVFPWTGGFRCQSLLPCHSIAFPPVLSHRIPVEQQTNLLGHHCKGRLPTRRDFWETARFADQCMPFSTSRPSIRPFIATCQAIDIRMSIYSWGALTPPTDSYARAYTGRVCAGARTAFNAGFKG